MTSLLSAGFMRLRKNRIFWVCVIVMAGMGAWAPLELYSTMQRLGYISFLDEVLLNYGVYHIVFSAVFSSLFLGAEYSNGTLRSKVIVGHGRGKIYLSGVLLCSAAGILICCAYLAPALALGIPLLGFAFPVSRILVYILCSFVMSMAVSSVFSLTAFLNRSRAGSAVICLLVAMVLLYTGSFISGRLNAPEEYVTYHEYALSEGDEILLGERVPNPAYLRGREREVYQFFLDFLPSGQAIQLTSLSVERLWPLPVYSAAIIALATGAGAALFRKKDLK